MDFVVVGLGLGALAVLLGVVMLGWMAPRAQRAAARTTSPDDAAREQAIAAQQRGTGRSFLYAGAAMLLATTGALAGSLDDRIGALLVTTTATVAAIGILLGGYLHRARNPLPRRRELARASDPYALLPEPPVSASLVRADVIPGATETVNLPISPHDNGDARFDLFPPLGPVEAAMADDAVTEPRTTGGSTFGEAEPHHVRVVPVAVSPGPESESILEPADNNHADATVTEEEEGVVVGFVVPAAHPAGAPSPPSRTDAGDDPS